MSATSIPVTCIITAIIALTLTTGSARAVEPDDAAATQQVHVELELRNGARVEGAYHGPEQVTLRTPYGDLTIPFGDILDCKAAGPNGLLEIRSRPGGSFKGHLVSDGPLGQVDTGYGTVYLHPEHIKRLSIYDWHRLFSEAEACWTFDRGEAEDVSPNKVGGTLMNGARVAVDDERGQVLWLDGMDDYLQVGNPEGLQIAGALTIAMWIRPDHLSTRVNPYGKAYGGEGTMTLEPNGTINFYYGPGSGNTSPYQGFPTQAQMPPNRWIHIALVRDPASMTLRWYVNGQLDSTVAMQFETAGISGLDVTIGDDYVQPFPGRMDDVCVFARALEPEEIEQLAAR